MMEALLPSNQHVRKGPLEKLLPKLENSELSHSHWQCICSCITLHHNRNRM